MFALSRISFLISLEASFTSRMALPSPLASSGIFLEPKNITINNNITTISGPPISGPPISQTTTATVIQTVTNVINNEDLQQQSNGYPPIPEEGLPHGWTLEQWQYYGQQYLDMKNRQ